MARKLQKYKWVDLSKEDGTKVKIKPFSVLYLTTIPSDENPKPETMWEIFDACVLDWKGFEDEDGKALKCNTTNKRRVAEAFNDVLVDTFNLIVYSFDTETKEKEIKN